MLFNTRLSVLLKEDASLTTEASISLSARYYTYIRLADEMSVHSRGLLPKDTLIRQHPSESSAAFEYRLRNYIPVTTTGWQRGLSNIYRLFRLANHTITTDTKTYEYILRAEFDGCDFYQFIYNNCLSSMMEDANGYLVVLPVPAADGIQISLQIVSSYNLCFESSTAIAWYVAEDNDYYHGYLLDVNGLYKIYQRINNKSEIVKEAIYLHNLNILTAVKLGGDWCSEGYYKSFFYAYAAFANRAIQRDSDLSIVVSQSAYPVREFANFLETILTPAKDGDNLQVTSSPTHAIIRPNPKSPDALAPNEPSLRYITPDVSILEFLKSEVEFYLRKAEEALYLTPKVSDAQSGTAKNIDKEEELSFLEKISARIFDVIIYNALHFVAAYLNEDTTLYPHIIRPTAFNIKSENELLVSYTESLESGNTAVRTATLEEYINKKYASDRITLKIYRIALRYDKLLTLKKEEIDSLLSLNLISAADVKFHYAYFTKIKEIIAKSPIDFLKKEEELLYLDVLNSIISDEISA
jgi:hypothetical protein